MRATSKLLPSKLSPSKQAPSKRSLKRPSSKRTCPFFLPAPISSDDSVLYPPPATKLSLCLIILPVPPYCSDLANHFPPLFAPLALLTLACCCPPCPTLCCQPPMPLLVSSQLQMFYSLVSSTSILQDNSCSWKTEYANP